MRKSRCKIYALLPGEKSKRFVSRPQKIYCQLCLKVRGYGVFRNIFGPETEKRIGLTKIGFDAAENDPSLSYIRIFTHP